MTLKINRINILNYLSSFMKISQIIDTIKLKISHGSNINLSSSLFRQYYIWGFEWAQSPKFVLILMQESDLNLNKLLP